MTDAFRAYDRRTLQPNVVHIGPGVFHRAHQAVYCDALLRGGAKDAAIWGVSLRSSKVHDSLTGSDFRYPLVERDAAGGDSVATSVSEIGSIIGMSVAGLDVEGALLRLTQPAVTVVTITVTEKGYCAVEPGGALDLARAEVAHDITDPTSPRSLPGLIVEALHRRRAAGASPFTVASCDNLPANGTAVARVVCELAEHRDPGFASWVSGNVAFPSSMVDRMVPATTDADRAWCRENGIDGAAPIVTEPFSQWVLEDHFPSGRPDWGAVGVELVDDVARHEQAKLRILNAAHSALAYWGLLAGHDYVWQTVHDPVLLAATNEFIECEVIPNLEVPAGWDLERYAAQVIGRFANRALPYTTAKVAGDGSQKLPVRLMPTVAALGAAGRPTPRSAQILAAWLAVTVGPRARSFAIDDPALTDGPAADVVRRGLADGVTVREAVDLLHRLPGFLQPRRADQLMISAQVTRAAHRMWHGDVRALLSEPVGEKPARAPSLGHEVQR